MTVEQVVSLAAGAQRDALAVAVVDVSRTDAAAADAGQVVLGVVGQCDVLSVGREPRSEGSHVCEGLLVYSTRNDAERNGS